METKTWIPGTDAELDALFNQLRETHYQDRTHRLWKNYGPESMSFAIALTICFDDAGTPELCSSIGSRECWPKGAYRIMNRCWKANNKIAFPRKMSPSFGLTAINQAEWLYKNTDCELHFISRETPNWEKFVIDEFKWQYNIDWKTDGYKYLTCSNEADCSCWQTIVYNGNQELLKLWKHQPLNA